MRYLPNTMGQILKFYCILDAKQFPCPVTPYLSGHLVKPRKFHMVHTIEVNFIERTSLLSGRSHILSSPKLNLSLFCNCIRQSEETNCRYIWHFVYLKFISFASTICSCPSGCVSLQDTWYKNTSTTLIRSPLRAEKRHQFIHSGML